MHLVLHPEDSSVGVSARTIKKQLLSGMIGAHWVLSVQLSQRRDRTPDVCRVLYIFVQHI